MTIPNQAVTEPGHVEKVDTTPANPQEADLQNKVAAAMSGQAPLPPDPGSTAGPVVTAPTTTTPAPLVTEPPQAPGEFEAPSNDAAEQLAGEEKPPLAPVVYTQAEIDAKIAEKDAEIERIKNLHNEQKGENIRLVMQNRKTHQLTPTGDITSDGDQMVASQTDALYLEHFTANKDVYSDKDVADFQEYRRTGNMEILQKNPTLAKLDSELYYLTPSNDKAPLTDLAARLDRAFTYAFKDVIIENRKKQALAEAEIDQHKKSQIVAAPVSAPPAPKTSKYTPDQHRIAQGMGVKLED